jgi:hypothetical protein
MGIKVHPWRPGSPLEAKFAPRGQVHPLDAKFTPRGQVHT